MSQDESTPADATQVPKSSRNRLLMAVVAVVLLGGGGGAYWHFMAKGGSAEAAAPKPLPSAIVNFDPFVVNLSDTGGARYLRVTLGLVVEGAAQAESLSDDKVARMRVRSAILELLAQETAAHLVTPEGKASLKAAIVERASLEAESLKITDVLFAEFIVQ